MALNETSPSQETWWALNRVSDFVHPGDSLQYPLIDMNSRLSVHEVWTIGLRDLYDSGFKNARSTSWRFVAGSFIGHSVGGEVSPRDPTGMPRLTALLNGPELTAALSALDFVRKLPHCLNQSYDLCILNIPGLVMEAFWLRWNSNDGAKSTDPSRTAEPDLIVPCLTVSRKVERLRVYELDEFLHIVRPLAKKQLDSEHLSAAE